MTWEDRFDLEGWGLCACSSWFPPGLFLGQCPSLQAQDISLPDQSVPKQVCLCVFLHCTHPATGAFSLPKKPRAGQPRSLQRLCSVHHTAAAWAASAPEGLGTSAGALLPVQQDSSPTAPPSPAELLDSLIKKTTVSASTPVFQGSAANNCTSKLASLRKHQLLCSVLSSRCGVLTRHLSSWQNFCSFLLL